MYFTIEPKSDIKDFFNYRSEYREIKRSLKRGEKIISLIGVRRVGKTSLLNVLYHELKGLKVWIDGRIISNPKNEIFSMIYDVVREKRSKIFGKIESVNISVGHIGLEVKRFREMNLITMEKTINKSGMIYVFIDEAQRMNSRELANILSYFYDRVPNVSFIISGSEIGLIEDVLGEDKPEHPLFGRHVLKLEMKRLDKEKSMEYLISGFQQVDFRVSEEEIDYVIDELDGLIGWLTLYGYERAVLRNKDALKKTKTLATQIVVTELRNFLRRVKNRKLYITILRNANGVTWSQLHAYVNRDMKKHVNPNTLTRAIESLTRYSFLTKEGNIYLRPDPMILDATFLIS
ncbi:MAG TPA: ATP-binding protein [Candidatus Aenigmarchaeota archaeon]|nr:ATP-binding protein [Candidatus Aenigmarchaeota archaeon]